MPRDTTGTPRRRRGRESSKGKRTIQNSVSLQPQLWERIDVLGDLTRWGRSGTLAQAVELLTPLPVSVTQRWATLNRTTVREMLRARLQRAVEEAIEAAEAELPQGPWAEFDAALAAVGDDLRRSGADRRTERELIDAASEAKRTARRRRRGLP